MSEKLHLFFLFLFVVLLPHTQCRSPKTEGFSLKLVRRDLLDSTSPFSRLFNFTNNFNELKDTTDLTDHFPDIIRPPITRSRFLFTIDASIGTPAKKRTFIFDPGSKLTWTQCTPCTRCFKQYYPLFDPKKSTSCNKLSPNHSLARFFECSKNGECIFNVAYQSGQSSSGVAFQETFTFPSNKNVPESIKGVVFGCSNNYEGQFTRNTMITGIMGMNRGPLSLISQMGSRSGKRFSYCLPRLNSPTKSTFLRFGNDVKQRGSFQRTGLLRERHDYSVKLLSISIAGRVLKLPDSTFSNGCVFDVGCSVSRLEMGAHIPVVDALQRHFDQFNLTRITDQSAQGDLCYRLQPRFKNYPSMTLHFKGANFEIESANLFRFAGDRFCLALFGTPRLTVVGAYQQQNMRLIYDIGNDKLLFAKEDCSLDKA